LEEHDASISGLQIQVDTEVIERRNILIMQEVTKYCPIRAVERNGV
jgi:hypothetical protein